MEEIMANLISVIALYVVSFAVVITLMLMNFDDNSE